MLGRFRDLSFVVQDVEIDLSGKELSSQQDTELQGITKNCRNVLTDVEKRFISIAS